MKVLIVVDMQNDFIDGVLGSKEAQEIVPNVCKKIQEYQKEDCEVIFTMDTHGNDYLETYEGKNLPVAHCVKGTKGWLINDEIMKCFKCLKNRPFEVQKKTFAEPYLYDVISAKRAKKLSNDLEIELVGVCTDICVVSNALLLKAYFPDIDISVDASCCAGTSVDNHNAALQTMKSCQIKIKNWSDEQ